ncbi:TPA: hypothetical protein ACGTNZ_004553, partial [Salmonella enterica]
SSLLYFHGENEGALKMLKFVIYGDTVKNLNKTFTCKYVVIRRDDITVIAEMDFFPDCNRSLIVDDLESGPLIVGVWHLTRGDDICHNGEAEVLSGPLQSPA